MWTLAIPPIGILNGGEFPIYAVRRKVRAAELWCH